MALPTPGSDAGNWGTILNTFLRTAHNDDGTIKNSAGSNGINRIEVMTQSQYDSATKSTQTLYIVT